jgi:guanylate kinase
MNQTLVQKLTAYQPSQTGKDLIGQTAVLLLVGPTGAGKDSVKDELLKTGRFHHIVSHTTRPPRINHGVIEQDGREYHFVDEAAAEKMLDEQAFIEAKVYSGNLYGTSTAEIQAARDKERIAMTDLEVQGVAEYKSLDPNVMAVFLLPPDFQTWQQRLQRRYGDVVDVADYRRRLETALQELDQLLNTDYYVPIVNDDLQAAVQHIEEVINSKNHTTSDESAARQVAQQLSKDIQAYLDSNPEV